MKILDYFEHPRFGVIVSSTDSELDNFSDDEIKKRIGDTIFLVSDSCQKKPIEVKSVDIATSLLGKKNINICLSDSIKLSDIKPDSQLLLRSEIDLGVGKQVMIFPFSFPLFIMIFAFSLLIQRGLYRIALLLIKNYNEHLNIQNQCLNTQFGPNTQIQLLNVPCYPRPPFDINMPFDLIDFLSIQSIFNDTNSRK